MKKIIFTLAAVGMLSACSLDETPYGFYSSDNFYKTEEDAESGLMYAYNALNYLEYLRGIWYLGDIPTETMYPKSDEPGDIHMLQQWTVNSETELTMYYFKYCYIGINRANTVIERVSGGNLNETVKNRVVGEALFLRAWNYFNLVRAYGFRSTPSRSRRSKRRRPRWPSRSTRSTTGFWRTCSRPKRCSR